MKTWIVLALLLFSNPLLARKATVKRKTKQERKDIMQRFYSEKNSEPRSELHFMNNAARDCEAKAYHKKDFDLQVINVYKSYPKELRVNFVKKNATKICLQNIILFHQEDKEDVGKDALLSSAKNKGGRYWPYTFTSELDYLAKVLSKDCREQDVNYFDQLLKTFYQQTRQTEGWCRRYHAEFMKNCPQFQLKNCK